MIRFFASHPTAANLLMILLMVLGLITLPTLKRETLPDFSLDAVQVTVTYPGATAEEAEEAICQRLEDAVDTVTDISEIQCDAREGRVTATIELAEGGHLRDLLTEVETEVEAIDDFPEEVEDLVIRELNRTDPVVALATGGPMSEPHLKVYAENLKERLKRLPEVSQVEILGFSERQIRIALDLTALRQYGLSVAAVADTIARQSVDLPAGAIETRERDITVRFLGERRSPMEYAELVVLGGAAGAEVRLGQIAKITDRFAHSEERVMLNGHRAALLQINKTKAEDALTALGAVEAFVAEERHRAPPGVTFVLTRDVASVVHDRLQMLLKNSLQGLVLVFLVLWLFFSLRFSFWVAMGLPASFLGSLFVMSLLGLSINMLTMVALLISIGLLMDDSIVIAENIASHLRRTQDRTAAAVRGAREVTLPVLSSFLTSIGVFGPLAFLEGDIGKVLKVVPVVLIITLAVSLIEAFLILPHHVMHSLVREKPTPFRKWFDAGFERVREELLGRAVDIAMRWRYPAAGLVIMAFLISISLFVGGQLKFRAFPELDGDVVEARILLSHGTPLLRHVNRAANPSCAMCWCNTTTTSTLSRTGRMWRQSLPTSWKGRCVMPPSLTSSIDGGKRWVTCRMSCRLCSRSPSSVPQASRSKCVFRAMTCERSRPLLRS